MLSKEVNCLVLFIYCSVAVLYKRNTIRLDQNKTEQNQTSMPSVEAPPKSSPLVAAATGGTENNKTGDSRRNGGGAFHIVGQVDPIDEHVGQLSVMLNGDDPNKKDDIMDQPRQQANGYVAATDETKTSPKTTRQQAARAIETIISQSSVRIMIEEEGDSPGNNSKNNNHPATTQESCHSTTTTTTKESLLAQEKAVRKHASHNPFWLLLVNSASALIVFFVNLVSMEMIISVGLSVWLTIYIYDHLVRDGVFDGSAMNFVVLTFAVITPLSNTINMAFKRRETALVDIAFARATFLEMYKAHAVWDWDQKPGNLTVSGRTKSTVDWLHHSDAVCLEILHLCAELTRYLTLPTSTRSRHRATPFGKKEAKKINDVGDQLHASVIKRIANLTQFCEILKREGLPGNEAARLRQWERQLAQYVEGLRVIKHYRTPQALRSFGRIFSMILPPFYAPFYADLGYKVQSLSMGILFAVLTSVALCGLFETVSQFEDPFVKRSVLDGVHVKHELVYELTPTILALRKHCFPQAPSLTDRIAASVHDEEDDIMASFLLLMNQ